MSKEQYEIVATDRSTGKRTVITGTFPNKETAKCWQPTSLIKRHYKYFRVQKHRGETK